MDVAVRCHTRNFETAQRPRGSWPSALAAAAEVDQVEVVLVDQIEDLQAPIATEPGLGPVPDPVLHSTSF